MCTLAAAMPGLYLEDSSSSSPSFAAPFPSWELEFDARGRVEVDLDSGGGYARCETGEVKSSANFASAIPQLGIRLKALAWVVATTQGRDDLKIRLIGRLFVPKGIVCDESQRRLAQQIWHYSLYIHHI